MPVDAPLTCWTTIEDKLVTLLSESAALRTWLGVANAAEALPFIHLEALDPDSTQDKFVVVGSSTNRGFGVYRRQPPWSYAPFGSLIAYFVWRDAAIADNYAQNNRKMKNMVGQVFDQVLLNNANTSGIAINNVTMYGPYQNQEQATIGATSDMVRLEVTLEYREP